VEQSDNLQNQKVICDYAPHLATSPAIYPPLLENFSHSKPLTNCKKPSLVIKTAGHRAASLSLTQGISSPQVLQFFNNSWFWNSIKLEKKMKNTTARRMSHTSADVILLTLDSPLIKN